MSAQPHKPVLGPPTPPPAAAASLRAQIAQAPQAARWLPAFDADWERALTAAQQTYDITPLHDMVRKWESRTAVAPAVHAFITSGYDDSDSAPIEQILGPRR